MMDPGSLGFLVPDEVTNTRGKIIVATLLKRQKSMNLIMFLPVLG